MYEIFTREELAGEKLKRGIHELAKGCLEGLVPIETKEHKIKVVPRQVRPLDGFVVFLRKGDEMDKLILFLFCFVFCFIGRLTLYLFFKLRKKKKANNKTGIAVEMKYLMTKFKLSEKRMDKKSLAAVISFLDALIISTTLIIVISMTENMVLEMFLGLAIVIALIYVTYEILGRILVRKGFDKDEL